jgi:thiol-disulfide isomerase/thioredoxin
VRRALCAALVGAALAGCRPAAPSRTLLFLDRSPAAVLEGLSWAPQPALSRIVAFDGALNLVKRFTHVRLATPVAVTRLGSHLLVSEETGQGVVFDTGGHPVREWESPDPSDLYAAAGVRVAASRSPYFVQFVAEGDTAPLLRILDTLGRQVDGIGSVHVPAVPFLTQLANAGAVAIDEAGAVWFAPLARDEIVSFDKTGARRWSTSRGLLASESDPVLRTARGRDVVARYAIANIALVLGPDGRLYALGADDSAATRLRLDVLDTASGRILATRHLGLDETAIAVDSKGRIETFRADSLLALLPNKTREPFGPPFALPTLQGDTIRLVDFAGKVLLINFWASWCDPCREEFPRMTALYGTFGRADFEIAAISDDLDQAKMVRFVDRYQPPFRILVGGGRMRAIYHYRGLPYSILLDRRGRIVERIFGFGGAQEFQSLRAAIAKEVRAP